MNKLKSFLIAALAVIGFSFTSQAEGYTTADYVQDGLVAMWDYSSGLAADGWKDMLSDAKFVYTGTVAPAQDGSGLVIAANGTSYATLTKNETTATFGACKSGTLEIVFKRSESNSSSMLLQSAKTAGQMIAFNGSTVHLNGNNSTYNYFNYTKTTAWQTIAARYNAAAPISGPLLNGVSCTANSSTTSFGNADTGITTLGGRNSHDSSSSYMKFGGTIACIRLYSRRLSSAELKQNAKVDDYRIFNPVEKPTSNLVVTPTEYGSVSTVDIGGITYAVIKYTTTGTKFNWGVPSGVKSIDVLVIGGGGSGGAPSATRTNAAGGGGAGGLVYKQDMVVNSGEEYAITVGAGGASITGGKKGVKGDDTVFEKANPQDGDIPLKALGGGGGAFGGYGTTSTNANGIGGDGGSGGAGARTAGGKGLQPDEPCGGYGNKGGASSNVGYGAAGGGAGGEGGAAGSTLITPDGGKGCDCDITGVMECYASGGDGGKSDSDTVTAGASGRDGYGEGGGAGSGKNPPSGKGGDGVVIIRYAVPRLGTGVQISAEGGMYGTPNPDYGYIEKDFPEEYTCPSEVAIGEGVRAVLTGWVLYDADNNVVDSGIGNTASFTVDKALTLKWQWKKEYQLTATAGANGALKSEVSGWYEEGAEIEVEAVPNAGYGLFGWTGNVAAADVEKSQITLTMGTTPLSVSAVFAQAIQGSYTVASSVGVSHGEVTPAYGDTSGTFLVGKTLSFSAPQYVVLEEDASRMKCAGYKIYSKESGELIAEDSPAAVGGVVPVDVVFSELFTFEWQWVAEYAVATACDAEQGSVTGAGWYEVEAQVSLQAKPKSADISFDYWTGDVPEGFETANPLVFAMPDKAVQLTAVFVQTYKLSVNALHGYTVSVLGGTSSFPAYFREGTVMTLQYGPNATAKYTWEGLPEDAVIDEAARTVSFTMPADELNLTLDGEDVINPDMGWIKTYVQNGVSYTAIGFTKTGIDHTFTVPEWVETIDYLVVGGGGAGGSNTGGAIGAGGGGAGAFVTNDAPVAVTPGDVLTIRVGAGGAVAVGSSAGSNGSPSSIVNGENEVALALGGGGGAGAADGDIAKTDGACGGGGAREHNRTGASGVQGTNGGTSASNAKGGSGGGGAGENGGNGTSSGAGGGGDGLPSSISGEEVWYAGGGGGGRSSTSNGGAGGNGGGGTGGPYSTTSYAKPGEDGKGGGGGGDGYGYKTKSGAKGGSGIVIIRYRNQATLTVTGTPKEVAAVTPACGKNEYVSGYLVECMALEYSQSADRTREYCLGWELLDAAGNVVRSSATTEDPDESALCAKVALAESMTLNWLWETRYELSVVSADTEKGTVTGGGYYAPGAIVELAATPTEGYRFAEWSNVPEAVKGSTPIQITTGESPLTITATFEDVFEGGVTVAAEGGQLGEPNPGYGDHPYNKGDEVTFSAGETKIIPDPEGDSRMALVGWKLYDNADLTTPIRTSSDDGEQYDTMTLTFGETSETLNWVWEKQYSATLTAEHGAITGPEWTSAGSSATYTAAANDGYAFDKWLLNGEEATAEEDASLVVADVEGAYTVEATFVEIPWGIDVVELVAQDGAAVPKTTHNRVFVDGPYSFPCPAEYVTLTENDTRLKCIGYTVDGGELVEDLTANVTFSRTQDPMPMTIEWQYVTEYYLAVAAEGEGTVDVASGWQAENAALTLTATPNDGFVFSNWKVDGAVALENPLEVTMTAATTVEAVFYDPATTERTWTGAKNANWSDVVNWYPAVLPTEETDIVISKGASVNLNSMANFKVRNLTIDGGTVTITQSGIDTTFEIGGNLKLMNGGKITCSSFTGTSSIRAINLTVNGEEGISIDGTSEITATGTAQIESSPGHTGTASYGASYGGRGGYKDGSKVNSKQCYGSIRKPHDYGSRGVWQGYAGGIIHLIATNGPIQITQGGNISADSVQSAIGGGEGSGGSVWLEAKAVTGEGLVSAKTATPTQITTDSAEGGAGRIAVYQTEATTSDNLPNLDASAIGPRGGAGTVYVENANDNGRGWLIVEGCGSAPTPDGVACCIEGKVTGYEEPFKKITIKNCANFVVAEGITLKTDELDIKGNGAGKIFANYKDVVMEGYGSIRIPQGLAIMFY